MKSSWAKRAALVVVLATLVLSARGDELKSRFEKETATSVPDVRGAGPGAAKEEHHGGASGVGKGAPAGLAAPNKPPSPKDHIFKVTFDDLDINGDGKVTREEFELAENSAHRDANRLDRIGMDHLKRGMDFWSAFMKSLMMIIVTELGDKTFFIAVVMAFKYDRATVFTGAAGALVVMTVLSVLIGFALPTLLPRSLTHYAAACLFAYFGVKLLKESRGANAGVSEELQEVEEEMGVTAEDDEEAGKKRDVDPKDGSGIKLDIPILMQAFSVTFLAEWGDRSQIATIALATHKDPYGVCIGGFVGHSLCTGLAVVGGRLLASRISERSTLVAGGVLFMLFAIHSVVAGP